MKYQHLVSLALAAALLTGCGGTQSSPSAAADQSSDSSRSTPSAVAQAAQTDRITDQYTLEKNVSGVWGEEAVQCISVHVPKLECDSPDAAYINDELNAIYAADFREFEAYEEADQLGGDAPLIGVGWDDWWYGDCVSLVVRSRYGGTAPWRYSGWCFDFATGRQLTVAEMLQRMGLDPDEVQQQVQRQAMQAFDREMAQGAYYEGLRLEWVGWNGILTGTAEGTQGRTEDGTELHFTLTDTDGKACEFWAILLNDDGSPSGCSLKYRAGEQLFDRDTRPAYWKNDSPELTLEP